MHRLVPALRTSRKKGRAEGYKDGEEAVNLCVRVCICVHGDLLAGSSPISAKDGQNTLVHSLKATQAAIPPGKLGSANALANG